LLSLHPPIGLVPTGLGLAGFGPATGGSPGR